MGDELRKRKVSQFGNFEEQDKVVVLPKDGDDLSTYRLQVNLEDEELQKYWDERYMYRNKDVIVRIIDTKMNDEGILIPS